MNNEPVAWMSASGSFNKKETWIFHIPLYTHPANPKYDPETGEPLIDGYPLFSGLPPPLAKTLTDEEIESWITEWAKDLYGTLYVEPTDHQRTMAIKMARAILKKASEK
jgi:hypothetical protein